WTADKLNSPKHSTEKDDVLTWKTRAVRLWPQGADDPNRKPCCTVRWSYRLRMPINNSTVISFGSPALGLTVTADYPPELMFNCYASCRHADGSKSWFYDKLFMPGQVVRVQWNRANRPE